MDLSTFSAEIRRRTPEGTIFQNPGGGISEVVSLTADKIAYVRGTSRIYVAVDDLYRAYFEFRGEEMSSRALRDRWPAVFDSKARPAGHSCNCTFLFRLLQRLDFAGPIMGKGVSGDPYRVAISG